MITMSDKNNFVKVCESQDGQRGLEWGIHAEKNLMFQNGENEEED